MALLSLRSLPHKSLRIWKSQDTHQLGSWLCSHSSVATTVSSHSSVATNVSPHSSIKIKHLSCCLATFYRPPSSQNAFNILADILQSLPHSTLLNLILLGDFNVNFSVLFSLPLSSTSSASPSASFRRVWQYGSANFSLANQILSSIPWSSILTSTDINSAWVVFKHVLLQVVHITVPSKLISSSLHPPWINCSFLSKIKRRNFLYRRSKSSNSHSH